MSFQECKYNLENKPKPIKTNLYNSCKCNDYGYTFVLCILELQGLTIEAEALFTQGLSHSQGREMFDF